MREKLMAVAIE
jgi:hypothetical protein